MTQMLTEQQTNEILKIAQRADKRTIGKGDIELWQIALRGLDYPECAAAVIEHYAHSTEFVMPAHIRNLVKNLRSAHQPPNPAAGEENHCGRPSCNCTHTAPCEHGWIDAPPPGPTSLGGALHCPTCHPGRRQEPHETRLQWFARLQQQDAAWDKKQRRND